jgi:hypothetical protein
LRGEPWVLRADDRIEAIDERKGSHREAARAALLTYARHTSRDVTPSALL